MNRFKPTKDDAGLGMMRAADQNAYSVVRLEGEVPGVGTCTGTGFFYQFCKKDGLHIPAIVTNKHVLQGVEQLTLRFHIRADSPNIPEFPTFTVTDRHIATRWIPHPDPNIDLAVILSAGYVSECRRDGFNLFCVSLTYRVTASESFLSLIPGGEDILMVGYPNGLWDSHNNYPIFRKGVTATSPRNNYEGRPEFLIDVASFPGSSGSPVFLYHAGPFSVNLPVLPDGTAHYSTLIGIMYAGHYQNAEGVIVPAPIPTILGKTVTGIPINLACVIKATELLAFEAMFAQMEVKQGPLCGPVP
ncbi:hypothetical protein GC163_11360 [bacterium]|nr:hypothetical protein [bacterium]